MWIRKMLLELRPIITPTKDPNTPIATTTMWVDNQAAIAINTKPGNHQRTKHWDVAYFWIREKIRQRKFTLLYKPTLKITADIFTKALSRLLHKAHVKSLGPKPCKADNKL